MAKTNATVEQKRRKLLTRIVRVSANLTKLVGTGFSNASTKLSEIDVDKTEKNFSRKWNRLVNKLKV